MRKSSSIPYIILLTVLVHACSTNNSKDYRLTTSVSPVEAGTVSPESGYFKKGNLLEITAIPNEHWIFDRWEGDHSGPENPAKIMVNQDLDITAIFTERTYPLNLEIWGEGIVSERIIQQKTTEYPNGTLVELTANPADGWHFLEWDEDLEGTELQKEITISSETNVTAKFVFDKIKIFGGDLRDAAYSSFQTDDGGLILVGQSASDDGDFEGLSKGDYFSFVLKLSAFGEKEWIRTFNGSDHYEQARSIIQLSDGGYIFTGQAFPNDSESEISGQGEVFITKLNSIGNIEWSEILWGSNYDYASDVVETPDGSIYVAGHTASEDGNFISSYTNSMDGFLTKLTADGNIIWLKSYGGSGSEYFRSMQLTANGNLIISGSSESNDGDFENMNNGFDDVLVMKLNQDGEIIWSKIFGGSLLDYANSVITSSDGGFIITGSTQSDNGDFSGLSNGFIKTFVIKLNSAGNEEWTTIYDGDFSIMRGYDLIEIDTNHIIITGFSNANTELYHPQIDIDAQIMVLNLNPSGSVEWFKTYSGSRDEYGYSITKSESKTMIISGSFNSYDDIFTGLNPDNDFHDIFVIKLDDSGELIPFD